MRIHIFGARSVPARWGGFDNTATELAVRLAARGHDVTVFVMPRYSLPDRPRVYQGVKLVYVPTLYGKVLETPLHELASALLGLFCRADIAYVLGFRTSWIYLVHRVLRRIVVFNTDGLDFQRRKWGRLAQRYLKWSYRLGARLASELVHDNTHIKRYFTRHFGRGGVFIPIGGIPYVAQGSSIVTGYGLAPGEYYLIACRLEPENHIAELVQGFLRSSSSRRLVVAGGASYRSDYVRQLQETRDPRLVFLGPVYTDGHIEELHYHSFAYLHGHEVGGTNPSLLKAMACRNLVLANRTPYNQEVLGDGGGLFFTPTPDDVARTIDYAERHHAELDGMRDAALARVRGVYSWDACARLHEHLFAALHERRPTDREGLDAAVGDRR